MDSTLYNGEGGSQFIFPAKIRTYVENCYHCMGVSRILADIVGDLKSFLLAKETFESFLENMGTRNPCGAFLLNLVESTTCQVLWTGTEHSH